MTASYSHDQKSGRLHRYQKHALLQDENSCLLIDSVSQLNVYTLWELLYSLKGDLMLHLGLGYQKVIDLLILLMIGQMLARFQIDFQQTFDSMLTTDLELMQLWTMVQKLC